MSKKEFRWLRPLFQRPTTNEGADLRRLAAASASEVNQRRYRDYLAGVDRRYRQGAKDIAHRLTRGDDDLRLFAARDVARLLNEYGYSPDPKGSSTEWLTRMCVVLKIEFDDLVTTRGNVDEILRLIPRRRR